MYYVLCFCIANIIYIKYSYNNNEYINKRVQVQTVHEKKIKLYYQHIFKNEKQKH
jgi:hypothetical protein